MSPIRLSRNLGANVKHPKKMKANGMPVRTGKKNTLKSDMTMGGKTKMRGKR